MRTNKFSKKCFFEALLQLYHQKPYQEIQISEICKEEYMMGYYRTIPPTAVETKAVYTRNVELLFAFVRKNPDFFLMMRDAHLVNEMYLLFREAYPYDSTKDELALYTRNFLAAGYLSVIYGWLDDGMKQSDRHMAELAVKIIGINP